ncbi:MAG: hypothetical protein HRT42_14455, partial [Campylobacteraceae bacterium]|nr:hypothetical protein [Campylobacteraceae bacterium]
YLKDNNNEKYNKWFNEGKSLANKYYFRYLLHQFNCIDNNVDYNEVNYHLPEELDYSKLQKNFI